ERRRLRLRRDPLLHNADLGERRRERCGCRDHRGCGRSGEGAGVTGLTSGSPVSHVSESRGRMTREHARPKICAPRQTSPSPIEILHKPQGERRRPKGYPMSRVKLTIATTDYDHFRDFRLGLVQAEGIDATWLTLGHHEIFARFTLNREW